MGRATLLAVFGASAAACALGTILAGKDVSWDLLNYHYYVPYEWLGGRLGQDYFAASGQSYLNPAGYLPFYLMVSSGWHSVAVSVALAAVHGASLAFLYLIAWKLFAHRAPAERHFLSGLASALGAATAIFWATVGTSFLDPLLVVPMLGGLLLLLGGDPATSLRRALFAGMLFGAACALKYSNVVFALAALPLTLVMPGAIGASRLRACLAYGAGGAVAVGLLAGPWLALMAREFGNPVFPLMNGWFRSPHAPQVNIAAGRFMPEDVAAALAFPFRMIVPDGRLYAEITAPDLRFAALALAAAAVPASAMLRRAATRAAGALSGSDWRVLGFFATALMLWLASSANGRYGLIVLLLAGVCLARLVERLLPLGAARIALCVLLVLQVAACLMVSAPRWFIADRWSRHWLPFVAPERARRDPALYLTVETLPMAAVAPFLHAGSSFVNVRGQYSLAPGTPRLESLLDRHRGHVRTLGRTLQLRENGRPREEVVKAYDYTLLRFGYRIDAQDCFAIPWQPDESDLLSRTANRLAGEPAAHDSILSLGSCALRPAKRDPRAIEEEKRVSALFDLIEKACAGLFRGQTALIEPTGGEWSRTYPGLDARLETHGDRVILDRYLLLQFYDLGPLSAWERGDPAPPACRASR